MFARDPDPQQGGGYCGEQGGKKGEGQALICPGPQGFRPGQMKKEKAGKQ